MKQKSKLNFLFGPSRDYTSYKKMFLEAKDSEFDFRIFKVDDEIVIHHENITTITDESFTCLTESGEIIINYKQISEIQSLPKSKYLNLLLVDDRQRRRLLLIILPVFLGFLGVSLAQLIEDKEIKNIVIGASGATVVTFYAILFSVAASLRKEFNKMSKRAVSMSKTTTLIKALEKANSEEEYFNKLINVNLSNMEEYYLLVKIQTRKSYSVMLFGVISGFLLLASGIILNYFNESNTGRLTIISGVLIEFIGAVFFYLYNRTVLQLNIYHDKLVAVQDTMLALRVAQSIKDDQKLKNETMKYLTEILTNKLIKNPEIIRNETENNK